MIIQTAREARTIGFTVFIITDLNQSHNPKLQEGIPQESLMQFYYDLADKEKNFSIKSTDLANEYFPGTKDQPHLTIQFSKWLNENECINETTLKTFGPITVSKSFFIRWYTVMILF